MLYATVRISYNYASAKARPVDNLEIRFSAKPPWVYYIRKEGKLGSFFTTAGNMLDNWEEYCKTSTGLHSKYDMQQIKEAIEKFDFITKSDVVL